MKKIYLKKNKYNYIKKINKLMKIDILNYLL